MKFHPAKANEFCQLVHHLLPVQDIVWSRVTMKRLCLALLTLALPFTADATPELAQQWAGKAADLLAETNLMIEAIDTGKEPEIELPYLIEVGRFTTTATHLSLWVDRQNGQNDLSCICHSMATIGATQLNTLDRDENTLKTRRALQQLAFMFADATQVAKATTQRSIRPASASLLSRQTCSGS